MNGGPMKTNIANAEAPVNATQSTSVPANDGEPTSGPMIAAPSPPPAFRMRKPCGYCGCEDGRIQERGSQDCVYCFGCDRFQYNAPRAETGKPVRSVTSNRAGIKPSQRARIIVERASCRCELCGTNKSELHVGHLLSIDEGLKQGFTEQELNHDENLAAMCAECNLGIGKNPVPLRLAVALQMARIRRLKEKLPK